MAPSICSLAGPRAGSRPEADRLIHWWEDYTAYFGGTIDNNPAPGNKLGGLTTIYEKSLGATAKAGSTPINQVVGYGEKVTERGFVHMDTPGYDPVSVTGQVAGGCNIVTFTTGRGSAFGFKPAPVIKIATNSELYANQEPDMDINAGKVLDGVTLDDLGQRDLREDPRRCLRRPVEERSSPASAKRSSIPGFSGRCCSPGKASRAVTVTSRPPRRTAPPRSSKHLPRRISPLGVEVGRAAGISDAAGLSSRALVQEAGQTAR